MSFPERNLKERGREIFRLALSSLILSVAFAGGFTPRALQAGPQLRDSGWWRASEIVHKIIRPSFPDRNFNVTEFGAVGDGKSLCTEAFSKAIKACADAGGGHVVVPKGVFLTGAIHLVSNIDLHLSKDAVIRFSTNPSDYLPLVYTRWEGVELMNYSPLIYAFGRKNVALTGGGTLDGQGDNEHWWPWKGSKEFGWKPGTPSQLDSTCRPLLMKMGDENVPVKERVFGDGHYLRPTFVEFYDCENVLISGVSLKNAPFWFLHPTLCNNVTIEGVSVSSDGPNTDGCDPESCSDVLIKNCVFNDGDDCIAIKSGRNNDGRRVDVPSTDLVITGCRMENGHGGVSIGSEVSGGCWNVYVDSCTMDSPNLNQVLRMKSNAKRGGMVKDIYVKDIHVGRVSESIVRLDMQYDPGEAEGYSYFPVMKNIFLDNVESEKSKYGLYVAGLDSSKVENIDLVNCKFNGVSKGNYIVNAAGVTFDNSYLNGRLLNK